MIKRRLDGAVIVVTGASSGIGREAVIQLAAAGARMVLAARREDQLHDLERQLRQSGAEAMAVPTDVAKPAEVEELARQAIQRFGRIDGWVNSAGVYALGPLEETPLDVFHRLMAVNYFGVVHGTRAAARQMRRQKSRGVIVNVSSEAASVSVARGSAYAASKHAVRGFTSAARVEYRGTGVELASVVPPEVAPLSAEALHQPETVARLILERLVDPRSEEGVHAGALGAPGWDPNRQVGRGRIGPLQRWRRRLLGLALALGGLVAARIARRRLS